MPSEGVRTALSLFLFVHLFAVTLALSSYASPSSLQQRLREVFAPYSRTLNFDLNHRYYVYPRFHLTDGPTEVDYSIEVEASGSGPGPVTLPGSGKFYGQRYWRYQKLANVAGNLVGNEEIESLLPRAIARSVLAEQGASSGAIRLIAHDLPDLYSYRSAQTDRRDPLDPSYYRTVYDAQVLSTGDLLKRASARDVAPVDPAGKQP